MTTADTEISIHSSQACFANEKQKLIPGRLYEGHLFLLAKINFTSEQFQWKNIYQCCKKKDASLQNVFKKTDMCKLKYQV